MIRYLTGFLMLLLAACADPGPSPVPSPPTPSVPRPGVLAFSATWAAPLGAALACGGPPGTASPFSCSLPPGTAWGVLPQPGNGGNDCVDPEPNVCFQPAGGQLGYHAVNPGMALISATTLPRNAPISIEAVVTATNDCTTGQVSYVGPVIYDGEGATWDPPGNYRSLYLSCTGGGDQVRAWLYGPTYAGPIAQTTYAAGSTHVLRIDWAPGTSITYLVDGAVFLVETPGSKSADSLTFAQDPHPALWFGLSSGLIGRFDAYTGP